MNIYMTYFDHWVKEVLHIKYYFRYADDIVILAETKKQLWQWRDRLFDYITTDLDLEVKSNWQIFPVKSRGIDFVGYVFYHTHTAVRKSIKIKLKKLIRKYLTDKITKEELDRSLSAYFGWLKFCDSKHLLSIIESLTGLNYSNWKGVLTTFKAIGTRNVRLVNLSKRRKYFLINFIYKNRPYTIKSTNFNLYESLTHKVGTNVVLNKR